MKSDFRDPDLDPIRSAYSEDVFEGDCASKSSAGSPFECAFLRFQIYANLGPCAGFLAPRTVRWGNFRAPRFVNP